MKKLTNTNRNHEISVFHSPAKGGTAIVVRRGYRGGKKETINVRVDTTNQREVYEQMREAVVTLGGTNDHPQLKAIREAWHIQYEPAPRLPVNPRRKIG